MNTRRKERSSEIKTKPMGSTRKSKGKGKARCRQYAVQENCKANTGRTVRKPSDGERKGRGAYLGEENRGATEA